MRHLITILLLAIPLAATAQTIETSEIDDFTGKVKVYTGYETLAPSTMKNSYEVRYCFYQEGRPYPCLKLMVSATEVFSIQKAAEIYVRTNKDVYILNSEYAEVSTRGGAATRFSGSSKMGLPIHCDGDLLFLETDTVQALRIHFRNGYVDFPVKPKHAQLLTDTYKLIKKELKKYE